MGITACQDHGATHQEGWKGLRSCPRILGKRMEKSGATGTTAPGLNTSDVSNKFNEKNIAKSCNVVTGLIKISPTLGQPEQS